MLCIKKKTVSIWYELHAYSYEPPRDKTHKMACAPSEDSDQPGHPPSLIRVFAVHMKKAWILSYPLSAQRRLWSDWADAQADLSLCWAHMSVCWFCHEAAHISSYFCDCFVWWWCYMYLWVTDIILLINMTKKFVALVVLLFFHWKVYHIYP